MDARGVLCAEIIAENIKLEQHFHKNASELEHKMRKKLNIVDFRGCIYHSVAMLMRADFQKNYFEKSNEHQKNEKAEEIFSYFMDKQNFKRQNVYLQNCLIAYPQK